MMITPFAPVIKQSTFISRGLNIQGRPLFAAKTLQIKKRQLEMVEVMAVMRPRLFRVGQIDIPDEMGNVFFFVIMKVCWFPPASSSRFWSAEETVSSLYIFAWGL